MPRYFFDVRNGGELASDEEGMILPTVEAVEQEAGHALGDVARDALRRRLNGSEHLMSVEVRDASGPVVEAFNGPCSVDSKAALVDGLIHWSRLSVSTRYNRCCDRSGIHSRLRRQRPCWGYTAWPLLGLSPSVREFHPLANKTQWRPEVPVL
jgi:hypothetical protein